MYQSSRTVKCRILIFSLQIVGSEMLLISFMGNSVKNYISIFSNYLNPLDMPHFAGSLGLKRDRFDNTSAVSLTNHCFSLIIEI